MQLARYAAFLAVLVAAAGCAKGTVQLANYPDPRIGDADIYPPPPPGFPWVAENENEHVERRLADVNHDGKFDAVEYRMRGEVFARGEDTDYDGRVDRWVRFQNAKLIEEQSDSDRDGQMDIRRVDTNQDGVLEPPSPMPLNEPAPPSRH